jgi:hypothetical protein
VQPRRSDAVERGLGERVAQRIDTRLNRRLCSGAAGEDNRREDGQPKAL